MNQKPIPDPAWDQLAVPALVVERNAESVQILQLNSAFSAAFPLVTPPVLPCRWEQLESLLFPSHQQQASLALRQLVMDWIAQESSLPEHFIALKDPGMGPEADISGLHVHLVALEPFAPGTARALLLLKPWTRQRKKKVPASPDLAGEMLSYSSLFFNHPDAIAVFDKEGGFLGANPQMEALTGFTEQELSQAGFSVLLQEPDLQISRSGFYQTLEGEGTEQDLQIRTKQGQARRIRLTYIPIKKADSVLGCYAVARDITTLREQELQLHETSVQLREILDSSPDIICSLDEQGRITSVNKTCEKLWGYPAESLLGRPMQELLAPEQRSSILERIQLLREQKELIELRDTLIDAQGNPVPMIWNARWEPAKRQIYCIGKNARERDLLEQERKLQEQRFRSLVQEGSDLIAILDLEGRYRYVSPTSLNILGTVPEDYLGKNAFDLIHPLDRDRVYAEFSKLTEQKRITISPFRFVDQQGAYHWIETIAVNLLEDQAVQGIVANSRDVTEHIRIRQQLQQSNERYRLVSQATFDAIWDWDRIAGTLHWTANYETVFGYSEGDYEPVFRHWEQSVHPEDRKRVTDSLQQFLDSGDLSRQVEYRYRRKDGSYADVVDKSIAMRSEDGSVLRMVGAMQDVSLQKSAERQLKDNEYRFRIIFEHAPLGIAMIDSQSSKIMHLNPRFAEILGRNQQELRGASWKDFTHQQDLSGNQSLIRQMVEGQLPSFQALQRYTRPDGSSVYADMHVASLETGPDGRVITHLCMIEDISQRLKEEQQMKLLQSVVTQIADAVLITRAERLEEPGPEIVYANQAFLELCGYEEAEVLGRSPRFLQGPRTSRSALDELRRALEHFQPVEVELLNYRKDGSVFWNNISIVPLLDEAGKPTHFISLQRDITLRKEQEELQRAFSTRISNTLQSIQDGFFSIDIYGRISYWNAVAAHTWQLPASEVMGFPYTQVFCGDLDGELHAALKKAMDSGQSSQLRWRFPHSDRWYEFRIYSSDLGLTVYFKDISEQMEAEQRLNELNRQLVVHSRELALSNSELEQFAYVASHDLQEPLRMVTSFLSLIRKKYEPLLDDKGRQYIEFAVDGAARMRQIILDLLEYSRVGRGEDKMEMVSLQLLVKDILTLQRQHIQELGAEISVDPMPTVAGLKAPLRQVFHNLISNALKYHKPGRQPRIRIRASEGEREWLFSVQDNGIGIEEAYFERIFVLFQRLHSKQDYSGTGIGLAVCKKILENMGGRIYLESSPGQGSTFYFTLPRQPEA